MGRTWALAALVAGIWCLSLYGQARPTALGLDAPATRFSQARADATLGRLLGNQQPHSAGSPQAAALRARLMGELTALGLHPATQTVMICTDEARWRAMPCATVTNITAAVLPGSGKAVLLAAHTDSVAAGPGAADDGSGVAVILETIRALKAREGSGRPVTALFSDGEEDGMLGAAAWVHTPMARDTAVVVNVDVRGDEGPAYLFQTSPGNAELIELCAANVPNLAASSLYGEIYRFLPNDTDLTPLMGAGLAGLNFGFIGNIAHYHTPLDRHENIEPASLQQQGDNMLAMATALRHAGLKPGENLVYLDVLGRWLPRLPAGWVLPLAIAGLLMTALAGLLTRRGRREIRRPVSALLRPPLLAAGAVGIGFALHALAVWISGQPAPAFATAVWMRLSLAFGVWAVALLMARGAGAIACWLWYAGLAIAGAIWAPGAAPYVLFPLMVAAPLLLLTVRGGRGFAIFVAALSALLPWIGLVANGEAIMGIDAHVLFTAASALGLVPLLPLLAGVKGWRLSAALSLLLAVVLAVAAGLQPAFSDREPQRLNLRYLEADGKARWVADPVARLPQSLRAAAGFSAAPVPGIAYGYAAPAGAPLFAPPSAGVSRDGGWVTLTLKGSPAADGMSLQIPQSAGVTAVRVGGRTYETPQGVRGVTCGTPDCRAVTIGLRMPSSATLTLVEMRRGLPPQAAKLLKARPSWAVPSGGGDQTWVASRIAAP